MTPAEREADDAMARAAVYDAMRARWEADLSLLDKASREGGEDISDIINGLQDLSAALFMASVNEQAQHNIADLAAEDRHQRLERRAM